MLKKIVIYFVSTLIFLLNTQLSTGSATTNITPVDLYNKEVVSVLFLTTQDSTGSGVIVKDDGTFVTCFHVIANADYIIAKSEDGAMYFVNGFRYINPLDDIAVLTLDTTRKFKPITLNSAKMQIGEKIYAISNPQGLQFVFSDGMINQFNKDYIQFSAPISAGSSGGALLNKDGKLLGVITSQLNPSESQNINFALPNEYYRAKINNKKIINVDRLDWTEFLVANADVDQFKIYTDYALNDYNFAMFYKYLKPFSVRYDIPDDFYAELGFFAFCAYLSDTDETYLEDAIKYFRISYEKKQHEETALFGLALLAGMSKDPANRSVDYVVLLRKKYPKSFHKLMDIGEQAAKCKENDEECFNALGLNMFNALLELVPDSN